MLSSARRRDVIRRAWRILAWPIRVGAFVVILFLATLITRGTALQSPYWPPCAAVGPVACSSGICRWSPDKQYVAMQPHPGVIHSQLSMSVATAQGCHALIGWTKWINFAGWTTDSRYAVFTKYDQYGNRFATAFDTKAWKEIQLYSSPCLSDRICPFGIATFDPVLRRVTVDDGTSVTLP